MGYYLSKSDQESIIYLYPQLVNTTDDLVLQTQKATKLAYLLRNAFHVIPEWNQFLDKFKIVTRENQVILKLRKVQFELELPISKLIKPTIFEILDALIKCPKILELIDLDLSSPEYTKLLTYCTNNNYDINRIDETSIRISQKDLRSE